MIKVQSPQRSMQGEETKAGKNNSTADKNKSARKKAEIQA